MPRTVRQLWPSQGRVSPAQPPLTRQPSVGRHTHFLLGLHPHKVYLHSASSTALQAGFQNHGLLSSLPCAPFPEQGLPNPLTFILSGSFCCAPHLPQIKNNSLSKVYLNRACGLVNTFFFKAYRCLWKGSRFNASRRCCLLTRGQQRPLHLIAGLILACAPVMCTSASKRQYTSLGAIAGKGKGYRRPVTRNLPTRRALPSQAYLDPSEGCHGPLFLSVLSPETLQESFWFYLFFFPPLFNLFNGKYCHSLK